MTFPKTRNWQFIARYSALALVAMSASACSLEERKTARVVIDLSELRSDRPAASRFATTSVNATANPTPAQPTWGSGVRALTSYSDLDCVMLNVMGEGIPSPFAGKPSIPPEKWDLTNVCSYIYPGSFSIPASLDQASIELSISVQKGPSRLIQVLGFNKAATLRCEDITLPMIVENDGVSVSNLFELGKTKVDLMSDATVEIQGNIASAKSVEGCGKTEMVIPFGSQGIWIPTACKAPYADVYLRKKLADGTLGLPRLANATARVTCISGQGPSLAVNPLSTGALAGTGNESAVVEADALALDVRWFADTTTSIEAASATLLSARYDVTAPTGTATLGLSNSTFIANLTNLSEAGRASIRSGSCSMASPLVAPEADVSFGNSQVALPSTQTLAAGIVYYLMVRDFAGNAYCPASLTYTGGGGNPGFGSFSFPAFINSANIQTTGPLLWLMTGACDSSQVDQVELFNESGTSLNRVSCTSGSFSLPVSGAALDGAPGAVSFSLKGWKVSTQVGASVSVPVTRDFSAPTVSLTLSSSTGTTGSTSSPLFSVAYSALTEGAYFELRRDSCTGNLSAESPLITGAAGNQQMTGSVPSPGTYSFYVRARDAAGNVTGCAGPVDYTFAATANSSGSGYLFIGGRAAGMPTHQVDRFSATSTGGGFLPAPPLDSATYRASGDTASFGVTEVGGAAFKGSYSQTGYALAIGGKNWISAGAVGGDIDVGAYLIQGASAWQTFQMPTINGGQFDRRRGAAVVSSGDAVWVIGGSAQATNPILKIAESSANQLTVSGAGTSTIKAHGLQGVFIKDAVNPRVLAVGGCLSGYEVAGGDCGAPLTDIFVIDPTATTPLLGVVPSTSGDTNRRGASFTAMPNGTAVYFGGVDGGNSVRTDFVVISPSTTAGSGGITKTLIPLATGCQAAAQRYRHMAVPLGGTQLAILGGQLSGNSYLVDGFVVDTANGNCVSLGTLSTTGPNSMSVSALGPGMMGGAAWVVGPVAAPELFVQSGNGSDAMWNIKFAITNGLVTGLATNGVSFDNRMQTSTTPQSGYVAGPGARDSYLPLQY